MKFIYEVFSILYLQEYMNEFVISFLHIIKATVLTQIRGLIE